MARGEYLVSVEELAARLTEPKLRVIDCRFDLGDVEAGRRNYLAGHIPGAVFADLEADLSGPIRSGSGRHPLPDPAILADTFARLGIGGETRVIVYDEGPGAVAARAWWLLRWLGHANAALLDGGFGAWQRAGLPVDTATPRVERREFVAAPRRECVLETAEIAAAGERAAELRLVDARATERFTGREEPIDAVAGHIPGALNLPFADNVDENGLWHSTCVIRDRLGAVIGAPAAERQWAVMCGSGVTACHLVIAGLLAGYPEPRVYVGSWSEWISDARRPVATGQD